MEFIPVLVYIKTAYYFLLFALCKYIDYIKGLVAKQQPTIRFAEKVDSLQSPAQASFLSNPHHIHPARKNGKVGL